MMLERRIGHLPVVRDGKLLGMITQTDLTRFQAISSAQLVRDAAVADTPRIWPMSPPHSATAGATGGRE
jgi:signal-transduction protein with cAMP-binding, CBS, and nucleotidyltransferase domain